MDQEERIQKRNNNDIVFDPEESPDLEPEEITSDEETQEEFVEPYIITKEDTIPIFVKEHWGVKVIAGFGIVEFSWFGILCFLNIDNPKNSLLVLAFFLAAVIGCVYLWIYSNSFVKIDPQKILFCTPKGNYQIFWKEVVAVETDGFTMCFCGIDKWVMIPRSWTSKKKFRGGGFVYFQCVLRKINYKNVEIGTLPNKQFNSNV